MNIYEIEKYFILSKIIIVILIFLYTNFVKNFKYGK